MGTEEGRPPARVVVLKECILDAQGEFVEPPRLEGMVCWSDGELRKVGDSVYGGWLAARSLREPGLVLSCLEGTRKRFLRSDSSCWCCWALFENCIVVGRVTGASKSCDPGSVGFHVCNIAASFIPAVRTVITVRRTTEPLLACRFRKKKCGLGANTQEPTTTVSTAQGDGRGWDEDRRSAEDLACEVPHRNLS